MFEDLECVICYKIPLSGYSHELMIIMAMIMILVMIMIAITITITITIMIIVIIKYAKQTNKQTRSNTEVWQKPRSHV